MGAHIAAQPWVSLGGSYPRGPGPWGPIARSTLRGHELSCATIRRLKNGPLRLIVRDSSLLASAHGVLVQGALKRPHQHLDVVFLKIPQDLLDVVV
jgi:hypothetical protein